jgi:prolyl-tRNA editing enzyme YbaK/EbsC (Cys-tRNA(Pro) deacylase)
MRVEMNFPDLPDQSRSVLAILEDAEDPRLQQFDKPARRAREAADLLGCPLGAVVKSLVFQTANDGQGLLVLVSGQNRVDLERLGGEIRQPIRQAHPAFVKEVTGFSVGAVPPFGFPRRLPVLIDVDLLDFQYLWAAAGSAHLLMRLTPTELVRFTQGRVVRIDLED